MPCGHGGICFLCAFTITKKSRNCHLCRETINKIYQLKINHNYDKNKLPVSTPYIRVRAAIEFNDSQKILAHSNSNIT